MTTTTPEIAVGARRTCRLLGIERHRLNPQLINQPLNSPEIFWRHPPDENGSNLNSCGGRYLRLGGIQQDVD